VSAPKVSTGATPFWPAAAAVAFNLIPIAGVLLWGWSAFVLIFLYWLENVIIGGRTLASMIASGLASGGTGLAGALAIGAFFLVHYGMFCFGHGVFVVSLFGASQGAVAGDAAFDLPGVTATLFAAHPNLTVGFASILLWQAVLFGLFLVRGEARDATPMELMASPYPRIIVLHVAIIAGGFLLMLLNQPLAGLVMLALLKTAFDVAEVWFADEDGGRLKAALRGLAERGRHRP
jgi:hypothetical protein